MMENGTDFDTMQELLRKTKVFQEAIAQEDDGTAKNPAKFREVMRSNEPFMKNLKENQPEGYEAIMDNSQSFGKLQDFLRKMKVEQDRANGKNPDGPVRRASRDFLAAEEERLKNMPAPDVDEQEEYAKEFLGENVKAEKSKKKKEKKKEELPQYPKTTRPEKPDCGPDGKLC